MNPIKAAIILLQHLPGIIAAGGPEKYAEQERKKLQQAYLNSPEARAAGLQEALDELREEQEEEF